MDKNEILKSLTNMFAEKQEEASSFDIENNTIEKNKYLTLKTTDTEASFITDSDYEAFVNLLKYYNTKELRYAASKLQNCKVKILKELPDADRMKIMSEMKELHSKLLASNPQTISFVEILIKDWIDVL